MSRLYGKYLIAEEKELIEDIGVRFDLGCRMRYLSSQEMFEVDLIGSGWTVKIREEDLLRMIAVDSFGSDEKNEIYYHKMFKDVEGSSCGSEDCLDDDTLAYVSLAQYYFVVSERVLTLCKRKAHLRKLKKVDSAWLELSGYRFHSCGGRPKGSVNKVSGSELERVQWNKENYDRIASSCVEKDWFEEFRLLELDCGETNRTKVHWKFLILRYLYKLKSGFINQDLNYEKKLKEMNEKYKLGLEI